MVWTKDQLVAEHKASLLDAARFFTAAADADFVRHLRIAGRAVSRDKRPLTKSATLTLQAGVAAYGAPADLMLPKASYWGVAESQAAPWCVPRGPLPTLRLVHQDDAAQLLLSPAPTAAQIAAFGATYAYSYLAAYEIPDAGDSTVTDGEVNLILLRAKVEAMRELAIKDSGKPVTLRDAQGMGGSGLARNQTVSSLYDAFLQEYKDAA